MDFCGKHATLWWYLIHFFWRFHCWTACQENEEFQLIFLHTYQFTKYTSVHTGMYWIHTIDDTNTTTPYWSTYCCSNVVCNQVEVHIDILSHIYSVSICLYTYQIWRIYMQNTYQYIWVCIDTYQTHINSYHQYIQKYMP